MNKLQDEINAAWKNSRHGAWAGRGFHYQHLVSCYILVRQWAGRAPAGYLVPEGLEDCVLELTDCEIWVQIKSRRDGTFPAARVTRILSGLDSKAAALKHHTETRTAFVLEQPPADAKWGDIEALFASRTGTVLVCEAPGDETVRLLTSELDVAAVIAEGIVSDLYRLVADASQENASLPFAERQRISTTEVERRIFERLEAEDPSAIDGALISGALEPVDFKTAVAEPGFYQGVKVRPGHVAAGLVIERRDDTKRVVALLKRRRHVLVVAPSGAGKSALVWLAASELAGAFRWFQITGVATAADADALIRFVRARRPTETSPIALTFDEVGPANAALWDMLVREVGGLPAVHLLGSVRQEDVALIASRSATELLPITLNEKLAETVWQKLAAGHETAWPHWREPFERSEGLMLEYVHLLTSGQRLFTVIEEQVQQRERDGRDDELTIIRSTAALCSRGGEVDSGRMITTLGLKPEAASRALKRLIDEHLIRESRPGVLGGLHLLRSDALRRASHDEVLFLSEESLWRCLAAATKETLPRVVQSILAETREEQESDALRRIADILAASADTELWTAVLTGLALGTLERCAALLVALLEEHRVQRAQWSLKAGTMTHDYKRHGTTTLFAALYVLDGTVLGRCIARHRHQEFLRFLNAIERAVPAGKVIHVILDNYAAHKHPRVLAWLARHPRWVFHSTPTSGSWLNAVKTFFSALTRRRLKRGVFRSIVELLQAAINRYLAEHNADPNRFVWTKPADQILAKVNLLNASPH